ncbi:unnamed protein product [Soboliphyme baturini]|uniref:G_PROTEIN_RECEP_F1_2 domain-containing protein n=1 Tax=Soboliphyme baturini TaxID=241478 RepID=A0A183I9A5_9BILA|nr:unnamed protein product [Soboliphyme baturini]
MTVGHHRNGSEGSATVAIMGNASSSSDSRSCTEPEDLLPLEHPLFLYVYPIILSICVCANTANPLVYQHKFLRASPTIRLLATKAIANTLCIISLITRFMHSLPQEAQTRAAVAFYWKSLPFTLFAINLFGTIAISIILLIDAIYSFPFHNRGACASSISICAPYRLIQHSTKYLIVVISQTIHRKNARVSLNQAAIVEFLSTQRFLIKDFFSRSSGSS